MARFKGVLILLFGKSKSAALFLSNEYAFACGFKFRANILGKLASYMPYLLRIRAPQAFPQLVFLLWDYNIL